MQYLIDQDTNVNKQNKQNHTPLCLAVLNVNKTAFNKLIPSSNVEIADARGRAALKLQRIIPLDKNNNTPLHLSILHESDHIAKELVRSNADIFKRD